MKVKTFRNLLDKLGSEYEKISNLLESNTNVFASSVDSRLSEILNSEMLTPPCSPRTPWSPRKADTNWSLSAQVTQPAQHKMPTEDVEDVCPTWNVRLEPHNLESSMVIEQSIMQLKRACEWEHARVETDLKKVIIELERVDAEAPAREADIEVAQSWNARKSRRGEMTNVIDYCGISEFHVSDLADMKGWHILTSPSLRRLSSTITRSECHQSLIRAVESHAFRNASIAVILLNCLWTGVMVNYAAENELLPLDMPMFFLVVERVFTVIFVVELCMNMIAYRLEFFLGSQKEWHLFDLVVVGGDLVQSTLLLFRADFALDLTILRILRVTRVTRAVRAIKVIRFFKELRMMIYSILRSGTSLLWSLLLAMSITYIFGVLLMSQVTDFLATSKDHPLAPRLKDFLGTLPLTLYTLYCCFAGGLSWKELGDDLADTLGWFSVLVLCFYVFFLLFVVSNILTGIFVDTAIQSAANDREEIIQEHMANEESELRLLKQIFEETDKDESGTVTLEEFKEHCRSSAVRAHFASMGLPIRQALGLFKLLDLDHSGTVSIEEFAMGIMRLKGDAKGIDLATLMYENKRMVEVIKSFRKDCQKQFDMIKTAMGVHCTQQFQPKAVGA